MREALLCHALALVEHGPGKHAHICDPIAIAQKFGLREPVVEDVVDPFRFGGVAIDCVGNLLVRIQTEMVVLPQHRADRTHLEQQPLENVALLACVTTSESACLFREVQQDRRRLGKHHALAVRPARVDDGGHLPERIDRAVLPGELRTLQDVGGNDPVGNAGLLAEDRDLPAVRRRPIVDVNRRVASNGAHGASARASWPCFTVSTAAP